MDEESSPLRQVFEGIGVVLAFLFVFFLASYVAFDTWAEWGPNGPVDDWTNIPMLLLAFCGLTQLVYVLPSYIFFRQIKMVHIAKGILLGAALVFGGNLVVYLWWMYK